MYNHSEIAIRIKKNIELNKTKTKNEEKFTQQMDYSNWSNFCVVLRKKKSWYLCGKKRKEEEKENEQKEMERMLSFNKLMNENYLSNIKLSIYWKISW